MKSQESPVPSRASLIASAAFICVVLAGAAVFFRDESPPPRDARLSPAPAALQPLLRRCGETPKVEVLDGVTRRTCTGREHPVFMLYVDTSGDVVQRAGLMVPMPGRRQELEERKLVGLELFSLVAGVPAESFLPPDMLAEIGTRETRIVRDGLVYMTQPMANVGLVFSVLHEDLLPEEEK